MKINIAIVRLKINRKGRKGKIVVKGVQFSYTPTPYQNISNTSNEIARPYMLK